MIWIGTQAFTEINPSAFKGQRWSIDDFTPFIRGVEAPLVFVVHPDVPAKTFAEFLTWAKGNRGKLSYSSYQPGTPSHFLGYQLNEKFDLDLTHVPYRGSGLQATALVAGHSQFGFAQVNTTAPMHQAGKLRILAVTGPSRHELLPDVPTFAELGYPEFTARVWFGLLVKQGTPPDIVKRYTDAAKVAHADPEVRDRSSRPKVSTSSPKPGRSSCPTSRSRSRAGGSWSSVRLLRRGPRQHPIATPRCRQPDDSMHAFVSGMGDGRTSADIEYAVRPVAVAAIPSFGIDFSFRS